MKTLFQKDNFDMKLLYAVRYYLTLFIAVFGMWLTTPGLAWARRAKKPVEEVATGGSWVMSYALVILVVALSMLTVCNSSRRSDREKPQDYGDED